MKVTVRDVAAAAGVSASTVSLVLNNRPGITESTRKTVMKAVESLGYQTPSAIRQKNTGGMISFLKISAHGHILNRNHNVFISDYIDGIETTAREFGYGLEVRNYIGFHPDQIIQDISDSSTEGVVVLATELGEDEIPRLGSLSKPVVFIDVSHPHAAFDFVDMDNEGALYSIIEALQKRGHTKVGLVKASVETRNFKLREKSFYDALAHFGLEANKLWEYTADSTYEQAFEDMAEQLKKGRPLPTAFFCVCDIIAYGCIKALKQMGLTIPEDVSIVGFDDLPSSLLTDPPLSSIKVSKTRIGKRAFQLLKNRIDAEKDAPPEKVFIGSELIIRQSIGENP